MHTQKTKGGEEQSDEIYVLRSRELHNAKWRAIVERELETRSRKEEKDTLAGSRTKASRDERFDQQRVSLHVSSE